MFKITDKCIGCTLCATNCPVGAISGEAKKMHKIDEAVCIGCGLCAGSCPQEAIVEADAADVPAAEVKAEEPKAETAEKESKEKPETKNDAEGPKAKKKAHIDEEMCIGCNLCVTVCPLHCLELVRGTDSHISKLADEKKCIGCGHCERICPIEAIEVK